MIKITCKKYVKEMVKSAALESLVQENKTKEKTRDIQFETLKRNGYLETNMRTSLCKVIFNVRSKTLGIKDWCPWNYSDMNCVACQDFPEIIDNFTVCKAYKNEPILEWHEIMRVGLKIEKGIKERTTILKTEEVGRACITDSISPGDFRALLQL